MHGGAVINQDLKFEIDLKRLAKLLDKAHGRENKEKEEKEKAAALAAAGAGGKEEEEEESEGEKEEQAEASEPANKTGGRKRKSEPAKGTIPPALSCMSSLTQALV